MRLKKVKIKGFKSFANPTSISFDGSMVAIVGPNGCGKSNIVDAFRWVMGEQSGRLRGDKMEDVLFAGTDKIAAQDVAEVTLYFDEATVTRRCTRAGESSYFIDGNAVRLKEVQLLFTDSGMGKNALAIFEQGKLDQIIYLQPKERRKLFDDAAGIGRFVTRKKESLQKLKEVHTNLLRLDDTHREAKERLEKLEKQAALAEQIIQVKKEHSLLTKAHRFLTYQQIESDYQTLFTTLAKSKASLASKEKELKEVTLAYTELQQELGLQQERVWQLSSDLKVEELALAQAGKRQEELDALQMQKRELLASVLDKETLVKELASKITKQKGKSEELRLQLRALREEKERLEGALQEHAYKISELIAKQKAYIHLEESRGGFSEGAKALLMASQKKDSPLYGKLQTLSDFIIPNEGSEKRVTAALSFYLDTLVVTSNKEADFVIAYAKEHKITHFSLLSLENNFSVKSEKESLLDHANESLVSRQLLGPVAVHKSLFGKKSGSYVTAEGLYVDERGVIFCVSSQEITNNILLRKKELKRVEEQLELALKEREGKKRELAPLLEKERFLQEEREKNELALRKQEMVHLTENHHMHTKREELKSIEARESALQKSDGFEGVEPSHIEEKKKRLTQLEKEVKAAKAQQEELRTTLHQIESETRECREKMHQEELGSAEILSKKKLLEEEGIEAVELPDISVEEMEKRLVKLSYQLSRTQAINYAAIEELDGERESFSELDKNLQDITKAKEDLEEAIKLLDKESRETFITSFEEIRKKFSEYFAYLFEGGKADLILSTEADIFEAGVEIHAQPPGKRMQRLTLLSGGEKCLTALALLFAFFSCKPAPFCILDEVDAPLDDANVERFTALLQKFTKETQFIVVTHNKKTMAEAEILVGVSMEEKGISTLLSLAFESAQKVSV